MNALFRGAMAFACALGIVGIGAGPLMAAADFEKKPTQTWREIGEAKGASKKTPEDTGVTTRRNGIKPKPISKEVNKGLAYLINQQQKNGGWGQGGGWRQAGRGGRTSGHGAGQERSDVGNTAVATLSLIRAGHRPGHGKYGDNVRRGVDFICKKVEASDEKSLHVTDVRDTQIQMKIGIYVDTFLSSLVLSEMKGEMGDRDDDARVEKCLNKVIAKIERNQRNDGTFDGNRGWASVLSTGLSTKALNRAKQRGAEVSEKALANAQRQAESTYDRKSGAFKSSAGGAAASDAGVGIYAASTGLGGLSDAVDTGERYEKDALKTLRDPSASEAKKKEARDMLDRLGEARIARKEAARTMVRQLGDARYVSGFGSNGGEEFLSYMNISEALLAEGGQAWAEWDAKMTRNLGHVQNTDGSWAGHHCITGRTFVTSTALLVLLADRAPVGVSSKLRRG